MAATRFILVRHGETEWNVQEREMGQLDSPLTPLGLDQARRLAARLAETEIHGIYSSDLPRAARTAAIICEHTGHPVTFDFRLRERNMGIFQGLTPSESDSRFTKERADYRTLGFDYVIPNGESARQRLDRTVGCLDELAQKHPEQTVLVITHGGILMGFFEYALGLPFRSGGKFRRPNAAINIFIRNPKGWVLETWGDTSHLEGLTASVGSSE
jgi:broad specificity phosphatase PhoE